MESEKGSTYNRIVLGIRRIYVLIKMNVKIRFNVEVSLNIFY